MIGTDKHSNVSAINAYPIWLSQLIYLLQLKYFCNSDGGEQITTTLTFLLIPLTLLNNRKNHWRVYQDNNLYIKFNYVVFYYIIKIQVMIIWLHVAIEYLRRVNGGTELHMLILICGIGTIIGSFIVRTSGQGNINRVAGYRTKRSMKNETLWNLGQVYYSKLSVWVGAINIAIGAVLLFFPYENEYYRFIELLWVIVSLVLIYILTEGRLKRKEQEMIKQ
ncbi:SdpI family protein [Gracilibacillus sp. S3-1-1]|uniref:SdpI family protein n=1 Tax=Gracilibacillus pellucidus TaxID=3095368 RepID=A0ACC6M773_9BACI|nr:SdpI family protein [Gracilibacillus sp. S3-1-1]MDX8046828.1 SdpI family protein [Gracilibacillus sp. S3-1-1]